MLKLSRKVLCVDWDRRSVRLVVARVGRGVVSLQDAHSHLVPPELDVDDPQAMGALLADLLKRHQCNQRHIIVDVPRDKAVINRLTLPPTPMDELAAAVQFQAMRELPFTLEQAAIDFVVTQRNEAGWATEVLLAAVRNEVLDRLRDTCKAAGLTPVRIGLRPYANLVSVRQLPGLADQRIVFVDVGPAMTEIDVIRGSVVAFSRAANVALPRLRPDYAPAPDAAPGPEASEGGEDAVAAAVRDLEVEITRTLQAYRAAEPNAAIDRIVIAGGTGLEQPLLEAVDKRFGLPCTMFDPTEALGLDAADGRKLRSFSAALGLAWGLSREGLLELDFLNPKKPVMKAETLRRRVRVASIAAGSVVGAAVLTFIITMALMYREQAQLEDKLSALRKQDRERAQIATQIERFDSVPLPIWLDDMVCLIDSLLAPSKPGEPPPHAGERMLVDAVSFDGKTGLITLRVQATSNDELNKLQAALEAIQVEHRQAYRVRPWGFTIGDKEGFLYAAKMEIEVLLLRERQTLIAQQEKEREKNRP